MAVCDTENKIICCDHKLFITLVIECMNSTFGLIWELFHWNSNKLIRIKILKRAPKWWAAAQKWVAEPEFLTLSSMRAPKFRDG
jgi:hypothetical protein